MIEEENMKLVNNMKQCGGKWTWTRTMKKTGEEKKSILAYMIISEEASSTISKAKINGSKEITLLWNDNGKIAYSGHRAFTVEMNNSILDIKYNQKQFMTKEGKFNLLLQKEKVSDIWNEDAPTEELYSR